MHPRVGDALVPLGFVEPARSTWTDERLDDFRRAVDERFDHVDHALSELGARIDGQTERIDGLGDRIDGLGDRIDGRIDGLAGRIDALHRTLFQFGLAQFATVTTVLLTLAALIVTGR